MSYDPTIQEDAIPQGANVISTGYVPREHQQELHESFKRFNVIVAHRRFGKTVCSINEMLDQALHNPQHNPHYAYIAPTYSQAEKIAWEYIKDYTVNIPGTKPNEGKLRLTIDRPAITDRQGKVTKIKDTITIWLLGAEKPDSIRGLYMDGVILDEFGEMNPVIWSTVVRQCLTDRKGWSIFIGTPKGMNSFYDKYEFAKTHSATWFHAMFKASDTGIIPPDELADLKEELTEDEFNQEMNCSFTVALTGFFYSKQMNKVREDKRLTDIPHISRQPVSTFWDLGISDSMAIWFVQRVGEYYHIIDYMEENGKGIDWWIKQINEKDYTYARHYFPHDGNVRELTTGKERWKLVEDMGLRPVEIVPKVRNKSETIDAVRSILKECKFDSTLTEKGFNCLANYQREWDSKNKTFRKTAKHDWTSHGSDAFGTFALGVDPRLSFSKNVSYNRLPQSADTDYDEFSF